MSTVEDKKEVAKTEKKKQLTLREELQQPWLLSEIGKAMPSHMKPERMIRVALTALTRTPKLSECTRESFFKCLLDLSAWGLEPDGRRAHLIPFENRKLGVCECTLIIDYKGLVELAFRSGSVKSIHADVVRHGDIFVYDLGRIKHHTPWAFRTDEHKPESAGEVVAAYCYVELAGDAQHFEVMTHQEIESIRNRSRAGNAGPWVSDWCEMAKKTCFRRASKWLPLSAELRDAVERDDDLVIESHEPPKRIRGTAGLEAKLMELTGEPLEAVREAVQDAQS